MIYYDILSYITIYYGYVMIVFAWKENWADLIL